MKLSDYDNRFYGKTKLISRLFRPAFISVSGLDNIPEEGPCIIAAKHNSYSDPAIIGISVDREMYYLGLKKMADWPFIGKLTEKLNRITLGAKSYYEESLKVLEEGYPLVIFAEGGLPGRGKPGRGAVKLSLETTIGGKKTPIIPTGMSGHVYIPKNRSSISLGFHSDSANPWISEAISIGTWK
jgi:1-acyl-sn-glycerol-3-phosphate acyltransferase